jgi:hypothetical protein
MKRVNQIQDADGIRLGRFLSALARHVDDVMNGWKDCAGGIRRKIEEPDWMALAMAAAKVRPWYCHGYPTFVLYLEQMGNEVSGSIAKHIFNLDDGFRNMCMEQWHEDPIDSRVSG